MRPFPGIGVFGAMLLCCLMACPPPALAQHGGGGHGGGMGGGRALGEGAPGFGGSYGPTMGSHPNSGPPPSGGPESSGTTSTMRGGLQLGPPGRWWDDKHFAKNLKLRPDQQQRMDAIFEANRSNLLKHFQDYQGEQAKLEALTHARIPDEGALYAQIDHVAQARAELEKANAHYLLQLRNEMDKDQVSRLEDHR